MVGETEELAAKQWLSLEKLHHSTFPYLAASSDRE
jgi:hypothetical protein